MRDDICFWPAYRQIAAIRDRTIGSRELLERYIARIETHDRQINSVVTRDFDNARRAADQADAAIAQGRNLGALHGLPITIKDAIETKGIRSTGGAVELSDHIPDCDAPVVAALKNAGAYIMGKTNLPRWSADMQAYNEIFGRTNNPWNLKVGPGGSSGGAAAAVSAGLTSFDIGTDIGGSIRFPAAFCGVFGHKPSFGIVPSSGYLDSPESVRPELDANVIGPIARSAEDLDILLTVLLHWERPLVADLEEVDGDMGSLRVAAWLTDAAAPVDADVFEVISRAVDVLSSVGHTTVDRTARPTFDLRKASDLTRTLLMAALASSNVELSHGDWHEANRERLKLRMAWAEFFAEYDIILMPVCVVPPFPHLADPKGDKPLMVNGKPTEYLEALRWTTTVGQAYLPSTVAPVGLSSRGLPIGIQVVGRYGADRTTIRFAGFLSELCGGYQPPPANPPGH